MMTIYTLLFILTYAGAIYYLAQEKKEDKTGERESNSAR